MISYEQWRGWFAGVEPVGFLLRDMLRARWVRFHNLPDGQRYPAGEHDFSVLLSRHNTVMSSLTTPGATVLLLTTGYSFTETPADRDEPIVTSDPCAVHWRTINMESIDPEWPGTFWHVYASEHAWQPGLFDWLIRLTATEEVGNVLLLDPDCRWALAPYDGGMDVILESASARDRLKTHYEEWLPENS